jgi:hypothetical protein
MICSRGFSRPVLFAAFVFASVATGSTQAASVSPNAPAPVPTPIAVEPAGAAGFDAARLRTGRFVYRNLRDGQEVARFTLTVRRLDDGNYRFTGDAAGFNQHWESVASATFEPISAALSMEAKTRGLLNLTLAYKEGAVTGESVITPAAKPGEKPAVDKRAVHDRVPAGTVDQRIDWAAVLSSPLVPGQKLNFAVYDPSSGVSPVAAAVTTSTTLRSPAGTFATVRAIYLIQKNHGTEAYEVWTTPDAPRMLLREVFANGMSTELMEASPPLDESPKR